VFFFFFLYSLKARKGQKPEFRFFFHNHQNKPEKKLNNESKTSNCCQ